MAARPVAPPCPATALEIQGRPDVDRPAERIIDRRRGVDALRRLKRGAGTNRRRPVEHVVDDQSQRQRPRYGDAPAQVEHVIGRQILIRIRHVRIVLAENRISVETRVFQPRIMPPVDRDQRLGLRSFGGAERKPEIVLIPAIALPGIGPEQPDHVEVGVGEAEITALGGLQRRNIAGGEPRPVAHPRVVIGREVEPAGIRSAKVAVSLVDIARCCSGVAEQRPVGVAA